MKEWQPIRSRRYKRARDLGAFSQQKKERERKKKLRRMTEQPEKGPSLSLFNAKVDGNLHLTYHALKLLSLSLSLSLFLRNSETQIPQEGLSPFACVELKGSLFYPIYAFLFLCSQVNIIGKSFLRWPVKASNKGSLDLETLPTLQSTMMRMEITSLRPSFL